MSDHDLEIPGMESDEVHSQEHDQLLFLAHVAARDAMHDTSLQHAVMQDADVQVLEDQNTVSQFGDAKDEPAGAEHERLKVTKSEDVTSPQTSKQKEASSEIAKGSNGQIVTADQIMSLLTTQSLRATARSSSTPKTNDEVIENEDTNDNANGEGGKRKKRTDAECIAAALERMNRQRAEEQQQILENMKQDEETDRLAAANGEGSGSLHEIEATGILPDDVDLMASLTNQDTDEGSRLDDLVIIGSKRRILQQLKDTAAGVVRKKFNLFYELSNYLELIMELAKHLRINDLVSLYSISKDFNETVNGHLTHILKSCAEHQAPESSRIFTFTLYKSLCTRDPVGRPDPLNPGAIRRVPSLRWLQMVIHREKCVRDILACMAREAHRMPKTMALSMKKMWLLMDIPTSSRRVQLIHNEEYWTDNDLYNIQMLIIKLDMRFSDPIRGPCDDGLRKLMLGQRGLTPLCHLLKRTRYTRGLEAVQACIRYSYWPRPEYRNVPILGVPALEVGRGHLEGWGVGRVHLYRPDELVMRESCRRNMDLKSHIYTMMLWGYVDAATGEDIMVTREEAYMSDDDEETQEMNEMEFEVSGVGKETEKSENKWDVTGSGSKKEVDVESVRGQDLEGDTNMEG